MMTRPQLFVRGTLTGRAMMVILLGGYLVILCVATTVASGTRGLHPIPTAADGLIVVRQTASSLAKESREEDFATWESMQSKCRILNVIYRNAKATFRNIRNGILSQHMFEMLRNCSSREMRLDTVVNLPFLFPGTNWCGQGNVAENYHDLGVFNETDACCREHDYCDNIIRPGRTKHNLINPYGTTRLHCKCDEALRTCLRKVGSAVSNTLGWIFFSLLQTQCFDLNYPTSGCLLWRRGAVRMYCVKYKLEENLPKKWQWFDQEPFF